MESVEYQVEIISKGKTTVKTLNNHPDAWRFYLKIRDEEYNKPLKLRDKEITLYEVTKKVLDYIS